MKKRKYLCWLLGLALLLSGCNSSQTEASTSAQTDAAQGDTVPTTVSLSQMFSDSDLEIGYDDVTSAHITLSGTTAACDSDAVQISGSQITLTEEGTYILSGSLEDGMVIVDGEDSAKVQLVLDNAQIGCSTSAAIYVRNADKVFITTAPDSQNTLSNSGEYVAIDDNNIDSVIFSKADLTLNGSGTLTISAAAGHGIVSKDDLVLSGGTYEITAASHGISGKDSVRIASGNYTITSGKDGIHAENADDTTLGFLYIEDGTFTIHAQGDGLSAGVYLQIEEGDFTITTGDGSATVTLDTGSTDSGPGFFGAPTNSTTEEADTVSQKGVKADGTLTISGGSFQIDTVDDAIHANGDLLIAGGEFHLSTGDDGIHSDTALTIQDGTFSIPYCYEGIEGLSITIDGGSYNITSADDGLNAAGGADSSGFGGRMPGQEGFGRSSDSFIVINGGEFVIVSSGDCIDSNGSLTINGGTIDLTCNGNGDTALDCDGTYTNNGGTLTTNDGSENNPGQMGGQPGGMGGRPGGMGGGPGGMGGQPGGQEQSGTGET